MKKQMIATLSLICLLQNVQSQDITAPLPYQAVSKMMNDLMDLLTENM